MNNSNDEAYLIELLDESDRRYALSESPEACIFFIEHYLMTFDPRPEAYPHDLDFILYPFQKDYVRGLIEAIREGHDIFDEKSRDMGASWLALAVRFWLWLREDGYQGLLGSRKEEYVDSKTYKSLFGKLEYYIRHIKDPLLLPDGFDIKTHRTSMKLINPANGNVIEGESSNANFSRAGRYKDILFDELGFWPDASSSWTAAGAATRCRQAVTTPPDEPSFAKTLRFSGLVKVRTWHWTLHPHKDDTWYAHEKTRNSEEAMMHEIDISWEYSSTGRPYPEINNVRVGQFPYNEETPLYLSIDLGLDAVAIGWYQPIMNTNWISLIEAWESTDKVIEWFLPFFGREDCVTSDECPYCHKQHLFTYNDKELEFIKSIKSWKQPIFFGDPSGKSRHIESGISPYTILKQHDIDVQVNDMENEWVPRRDATRQILPRLVMNDTPRTQWWRECVKDAHYPKRDENSQAVTGITKPVHDWTSHHRTQTEFFAVNYKEDYAMQDQPKQFDTNAYMDDNGRMVGGEIDIGKILKNANRRRR
jgi:hypothetical protein